jgi:hypothetical protein
MVMPQRYLLELLNSSITYTTSSVLIGSSVFIVMSIDAFAVILKGLVIVSITISSILTCILGVDKFIIYWKFRKINLKRKLKQRLNKKSHDRNN